MFLAIFGWITLVEKFHCCIIFCPHEIALFYKLVICPWDGGQNSKFNKEGGSLHHQTFMLPSILFYCDHKYKYKYKQEQKKIQKRFARLSYNLGRKQNICTEEKIILSPRKCIEAILSWKSCQFKDISFGIFYQNLNQK